MSNNQQLQFADQTELPDEKQSQESNQKQVPAQHTQQTLYRRSWIVPRWVWIGVVVLMLADLIAPLIDSIDHFTRNGFVPFRVTGLHPFDEIFIGLALVLAFLLYARRRGVKRRRESHPHEDRMFDPGRPHTHKLS